MSTTARILIVDDELPVARSIAGALAGRGWEVEVALSGEEALKLDAERNCDVVVADLMMPGISGMELLRLLKERRPRVIVIMVTGYPSVRTAVQAVKDGAYEYLPKPFTPDELRTIVARALSRQELFDDASAPALPAPAAPDTGTSLWTIPDNAWARLESDGSVRIGAHPVLVRTIGGISTIDLPRPGEVRQQGEACASLVDREGKAHRLWCPISGRITAVNADLAGDPSPLGGDPFGAGWLLLLEPLHLEDDLENLQPFEG